MDEVSTKDIIEWIGSVNAVIFDSFDRWTYAVYQVYSAKNYLHHQLNVVYYLKSSIAQVGDLRCTENYHRGANKTEK